MVFIAELGDKTQFLMIAMASQYKIRDILLGVGGAICVLNLLAIAIGTVLGGVLPTSFISLVAGAAFLCFAVMAVGNKDESEVGAGSDVKRGAVFSVFGTFFLAELGDKTQLTALTLAAASSAEGIDAGKLLSVFFGASLALFAADVLGLAVGYFLGKTLPSSVFAWISFGIFAVFGVVKLLSGFEGIFSDSENSRFWVIFVTSLCAVAFAAISLIKMFAAAKREVDMGERL